MEDGKRVLDIEGSYDLEMAIWGNLAPICIK